MNFHPKFDYQQNQKNNITDYQGTIPNRKLTVKRGVFPYAIHANPVSKGEVFVKDRHNITSNKNNNFQMPKNTSNLFDKQISNDGLQFGNKTKPSASSSTGFFDSNPQQQATPVNFKKSQNYATFSNTSTTTEMNKKILLNQYVTEQYNAVFKNKISTNQPKYVNFDANEAVQICTYRQIGEAINQSFIEASSKFKCSLERRSSIRENLRKLHKKRKREQKLKETSSKNTTDQCEYTSRKHERLNKNYYNASFHNNEQYEKNHVHNKSKSNQKETYFKLNGTVLENDTLSHKEGCKISHNQFKRGNGRDFHRSPNQCSTKEKKYIWRSPTPSSSPITNHYFAHNFNQKKQKSDFFEKLGKKSPVLPTQQGIFPQNNHPNYQCKAVNSPTLFFSDTEESITTPNVDKNNVKKPFKNDSFSLDSAVFKRNISPELINPIDLLKGGCKKSKVNKKKSKRRKIITPNPSYSDSTCHGIGPFKRPRRRDQEDEFLKYKYSKFDLNKSRYNFS